jgi:hypothetical protein
MQGHEYLNGTGGTNNPTVEAAMQGPGTRSGQGGKWTALEAGQYKALGQWMAQEAGLCKDLGYYVCGPAGSPPNDASPRTLDGPRGWPMEGPRPQCMWPCGRTTE